ncbi:amino acid adenylation domain-containing protein [Streptomyces sp. NPDC017520]|uniref:amino acid adenylation domain-containing protein n=1 Tax=Streptomyces sp. NPDC017520 TaxID=3364998 RepID=UPI0037AD8055
MTGATRQARKKELLKYLLLQVKQKELDADLAKEFIRAIGPAQEETDDPIAVVGIACRLPGAPDKETFWSNLVDGRESIGDFPELRVEDLRRIDGGAAYVKRGGYLDRVDLFDPEYFGIPPKAAEELDPYHRNMMEVLVETMEDAGYSRSDLHGSKTGIFVGNDHTHRMMKSYLPFLPEMDFAAVSGSWSGILASRLSYHLNFRGPAAVLDTGCSSGLIALDAAAKAIRQGDCDTAFVGAINLLLQPLGLGNETESDFARVRAFDAAANGTVWSEGVAGLLVKPLSRALADRDHVYGIVIGNAVNSDGRSNGITAPNARSQQELLISAWKRAGIAPESLSYIEAHGTGTSLGDPIEIKGLKGAFGAFTNRKQFCAIGSVKTNVGHTVGAAGLVSLIKTLLSLEHGVIPPSLHFDVPNAYGDLADSPVYVNDRLGVWEEGETPRRAGVSSFSLTGTNSHVVLEEAPAAARRSGTGHGPNLYPVSARNEDLLVKTAAVQLSSLENHPEYRLDDVCFTMQVGREHQPVRAVIMCDDRAGLVEGLRRLLRPHDERASRDDVVVWRADPDFPTADTGPRDPGATAPHTAGTGRRTDLPDRFRHLSDAARQYLEGRDRPFAALERDADVRRVPLPPQLFDHARYWDESVRAAPGAAPVAEPESGADDWVREILEQPSPLAGEPDPEPHRCVIAWVWSDVLGYPTVRGGDDFFALGGDSVSSIKITNILNAQLDLDIPVGALLAERYFDDFAQVLNQSCGLTDEYLLQRSNSRPRDVPRRETVVETYELPLTASQRGIFWSSRLDEESIAYNETALTMRQGTIDMGQMQAGIRALVRRHDSLRSTFHLVDGEPLQRVHAEVPVTIDHRRLARPAGGETHEDKAREQMKEFVRPFQLDEGPLFRVGYFEFDDDVSCVAVDFHHTVIDGMSMGILLRDFSMIFDAVEPPPLARSYRSAILELRERQSGTQVAAHRDYWVSRFADGVPTLQLTTDWQRAGVITGSGATHFVELDARTLEEAKRYASGHNLTLYTVLLGVFQQLLSRMSGHDDIVVGAPVMGRPDLTYQDLVGMFVNTLPLRITADPESSVDDFFTDLRSTVLGAFEHQIYPLESIIEEIAPPREPGRRPMFDVCFVHQNVDMGLDREDGQVILFDDGSTKYDITLSTRVVDDRLLMKWEYATGLFTEETIALYADRYVTLLRSFLSARDDAALDTLDLMPSREVERIQQLATTPTPARDTVGVVGLFERQVAADPDKTALIMGDERMSYRELNIRANRVAHGLTRQGSANGRPVALLMDRSFDMVVAILGVLKAGGHYLPLSLDFPAERLAIMVNDSGADTLVASAGRMAQATEVASAGVRVTNLDSCMGLTGETGDPGLPSRSDDPIYIMYTSGTTGVPKGSVVRQRGALRVARPSTFAQPDSSDVFLMLSDYSFDGSVYDIFGALTNGASLVIMDKADVLDLDRLGTAIEQHEVTSFFITTAMFNALIDHAPERLGSIRKMIFGGEVASPSHVKRAFDLLGTGRIAHAYGPTESTVFATVHRFDSFDERDAIPIGRPINDTSLWVLDEKLRLQPIGAQGELYIGGDGLVDGYLHQPELTEERFVTSPAVPGRRLYKTGDLVTLKNNGLIYYAGRIDDQIKLRGYRIELAEIIHVALEQPYVQLAYAGTYESGEGGRSLCLWVRYAEGFEPDDARLRSALERRLPPYMVPAFTIPTDEIPLNKNGKVDVAALPRPEVSSKAEASGPTTDMQRRIAAAWSRVLGSTVEDVDANFFALGGDSIKAIQIVSALKQADIPVQVGDLLEHLTVRTLAEKAAGGPEGQPEIQVYDQAPVTGRIVPSPIQQQFLSDVDNHVRVFTQSMLITFAEPVPEDRLVHAVSRLARYHDLLRVQIDDHGGLLIRDPDAESLVHAEAAPEGLAEDCRSEYLRSLQAHVDVRGGPAVAVATGLGEQGEQCALAVHHLAVDVVSWGVLVEDLLACLADPDVEFAPKSMPFPDWVAELERYTRDGGFGSQVPYWTDLAQAASGTADLFPERDVAREDTVAEVIRFDEADVGGLFDKARDVDQLDAGQVIMAVIARALGTWKGRDRILFTLEGHGREPFGGDHDLSRTVGWFTSAFPHLVKVEDGVDRTLDSIRRSFENLPDKGFAFGALRWFDSNRGEERDLLAHVRPQVSFNYLGDQSRHAGDIEVLHLPADVTVARDHRSPFVLDFNAFRNDGDILVEVRYPVTWRERGDDRDLFAAVRAAFREIRDTVTAADRMAMRTSTSVDKDVLDSVLLDVLGEN